VHAVPAVTQVEVKVVFGTKVHSDGETPKNHYSSRSPARNCSPSWNAKKSRRRTGFVISRNRSA